MKKETNIVLAISLGCLIAASGFVVAGLVYAVLGRTLGFTGESMQDHVVYGVRTAGTQFIGDMYGGYAHAVPLTANVVLAPSEFGVVATTYEQSPAWMRIPCGRWRATGVPTSPYAVMHGEKIYSIYETESDVFDVQTAESMSVAMSALPEVVRGLATGQVYGTDALPAGVERLGDVARQSDAETILVQMDDYSCTSTFFGGLGAVVVFGVATAGAWVYDRRRS